MAAPPVASTPSTPSTAGNALGHLAVVALDLLGDGLPAPTLDELADAVEGRGRRRDADRPRVLLVDSEHASRQALADALTAGGCEVVVALRAALTAAYACRMQRPTVVVTELDLRPSGVWGGLQLLATLAKEQPQVPVLVVTRPDLAAARTDRSERAVSAAAVLVKPVAPEELVEVVRRLHRDHLQAAHPRGGADGEDAHRPG